MERGEPALVPEWLRSTGSGSSGGSSGHLFATSSSLSDTSSSARGRNRISKGVTSFDSPRLAFLDWSSSSNSRRSASNGSAKNAYSSFSRNHRDKDRDRDKESLNFGGDPWDHDSSDPLGSIVSSRGEKDTLRRSHSMVTRKQGEVLGRKVAVDFKNGSGTNHANGNGSIPGGIPQKGVSEKEFPSLGSEERSDIVRVSSPGLSSAARSLQVSSSSLLAGEGWTSALAEVPNTIGGSSCGSSSGAQVASAAASGASSGMTGLNMAEALTQAPPRTRIAPQLSVQTQRLEELALKQSRQLIPMTPSMPKSSVLNSSEKSKPKTLVRSSDITVAAKNMQQQPSSMHPVNQSHLGGVKADASKTSHGKLLVLKPIRENGASPSPKDVTSPTNNVGRMTNSLVAVPSAPSAPTRSPTNPKLSAGERKPSALNLMSGFSLEKKPSLSQTQSRNDFFNLLKKKNSTNASGAPPESISVSPSPTSEKSSELHKEVLSAPPSPQAIKDGPDLTDNGGSYEEVQRFSEEEAAFLRSLGWEENSGEEEGLTEEEINAFYEECMKRKPSLKLFPSVQHKLLESRANSVNGASAELSSSESGSDA